MSTQWRTGMSGAIGLDYACLPTVMQFIGIPKQERSDVFHAILVMEDSALATMRKHQT